MLKVLCVQTTNSCHPRPDTVPKTSIKLLLKLLIYEVESSRTFYTSADMKVYMYIFVVMCTNYYKIMQSMPKL